MVDEETQDVSAGPAGSPPNRDARRDPGVIEGEMAARAPDDRQPPPSAAPAPEGAAQPRPQPAAEPQRTGARSVLAGALAEFIVSALALAAGYSLLAPKADVAENADRLAEVEAQTQRGNAALDAEAKRDSAALSSLDKRVGALEAGAGTSGVADLDKRVSALEAANADYAPKAAAVAQADQQLATQVKDLRADIDAARGEIPGLAARVAKLETGAPTANGGPIFPPSPPGSTSSRRRSPRRRAKPASPPRSRRPPTTPRRSRSSQARLRIGSLRARRSEPRSRRFSVSGSIRPDWRRCKRWPREPRPGALWPHRSTRLRRGFWLPRRRKRKAGIVDRLLAHLRSLVQVRDLNDTTGDDPQATVSRIEAASRRDDISGALAAFDKLPEAARQAAGDWPVKARARQAADAALQSIREAAIGRLAGGAGP